jgi:hypothetical protein
MSAITENLIGQKVRSRNWQLARENWGEASVNPVKKGTGKRLEWDVYTLQRSMKQFKVAHLC